MTRTPKCDLVSQLCFQGLSSLVGRPMGTLTFSMVLCDHLQRDDVCLLLVQVGQSLGVLFPE